VDPEEPVTAELLTRLINHAYLLGATGGPHPSSSGKVMDLLRQVRLDRGSHNSRAGLDDLVRAVGSDPLALRAAASWVLAESPNNIESRAAASLLFEASLRASETKRAHDSS
jgi:hypothetical protein